jgi:hypothetical protein
MGHWYDTTGKPCHWIEGANGKQRDTTLRDARKLNLYPSVTTILGTIDKPALNRWKETQILLAAMTLPAIENEPVDKFSKRVMNDAFKESTEARDRGSEIHNAIESLVLHRVSGKPLPSMETDIFDIAAVAWAEICKFCETESFIAEATVAGDGYGGMVDLHNDDFLIDYKTKDIKSLTTRMAYPEQAMQLAAYDRALFASAPIPTRPPYYKPRRCINVFIDRTEPGKVIIHEWKPEEIELAWKKFKLLVQYWQLDKNYHPEQP